MQAKSKDESLPGRFAVRALLLIAIMISSAAISAVDSAHGEIVHPFSTKSTSIALGNALTIPVPYVVIILMENQNFANVIGNWSAASYLNQLATDYGTGSAYYDVSNNYSLPNYLGLTTGQTFSSWSSCNKSPPQCPGFVPISTPTIIDEVENAGLTWKAYMENMPSNCYQNDSGLYVARHNPFVYFSRVTSSPAECDLVVPAGDNASRLVTDLSSISTASNLMWLTPNMCDDMHSCPVSTGDTYLSRLVPQILNSTVFRNKNAAIFITWDEGYGKIYNHVPAIWAGPPIVNSSTSSVAHNHYSLLKTLEALWHLPTLTSNDAGASPMIEFFKTPIVDFTYSPSSPETNQAVTFEANASGGMSPYLFNWNFGDRKTASGTAPIHVFETAGNYRVTLAVTDALNRTETLSQMVNLKGVDPQPPLSANTTQFWLLDTTTFAISVTSALITILVGLYSARSRVKKEQKEVPVPSGTEV